MLLLAVFDSDLMDINVYCLPFMLLFAYVNAVAVAVSLFHRSRDRYGKLTAEQVSLRRIWILLK